MTLKVENINKTYYRRRRLHKLRSGKEMSSPIKKALDSVSFSLESGIYALMGPNGAGKTTLINIIVGNLKPDTGLVSYKGQDIFKMGAEYRKLIGYMPQHQWMYENMTVMQFLYYIATLKDVKKGSGGKERIEQVLDLVNLTQETNKKIGALSGGMKQRLLIAQAILNDPDILILDEPTAGVDPNERIRIKNLISRISFNKIVVIATHVVPDVEYISKEIILLKEGAMIHKDSQDHLTKMLEGKVFECHVPVDKLHEFEKSHNIVSMVKEKDIVKARIISDYQELDFDVKELVPSLEDVYLYNYRSSIRLD